MTPPRRSQLITRIVAGLALGGAGFIAWSLARDSAPLVAAVTNHLADAPTVPAQRSSLPIANLRPKNFTTIEAVKNFYRREQVAFELALEQRRYGAHYWQPEAGGNQLAALHAERLARLAELSSERRGVLRDLGAPEADLADKLTPLFSPENAGPNLTFLSDDSRAQLEDAIAALALNGPADRSALLARSRELLNEEEFAAYARWNAPAPALRRAQLVGFDVTETEFNLLAQWPDFVNARVGEPIPVDSPAHSVALQLGAARFIELLALRAPALQTAVQDLHRLGLPLEHAGWLRDFRAQATQTMQSVWLDPATSPTEKRTRVSQLEHAYRASLIDTLSPTGAAFDETELLP